MDYTTILLWLLKVGAVAFLAFLLSFAIGLLLARLFTLSRLYDDDADDAQRMRQSVALAQLKADMDRRRQERAADARELRKGGDHAA